MEYTYGYAFRTLTPEEKARYAAQEKAAQQKRARANVRHNLLAVISCDALPDEVRTAAFDELLSHDDDDAVSAEAG
jgi:hypothetical protein